MSFASKLFLPLAVSAAVVVAGLGAAQAESVAEKRTATMKAMAGHMKALAAVAKGEAAYSPAIDVHAEGVQTIARVVPLLFPEGSGGEKTRSKPEVWSNWDGFAQKAADLEGAVPQLVAAAKTGDPKMIGPALGAVGKTCGGCHDDFRKPKEKN